MIRTAILTSAMVLVAGCGGGDGSRGGAARRIQPYDVVSLDTMIGEGAEVSIRGARVTADGQLQVLLEGFACGAPTKLVAEETADQVRVTGYGARYDDDAICTANIVPWFVPVELGQPLAQRELIGTDGQQIAVSDCGARPSSRLCDPLDAS